MSTRGDIIRGAGGHLKRNTGLGVDVGPPHGGEEGEIRINMVNNQPRLYARAGNQWYSSLLYKNPIDNIFEDSSLKGVHVELDRDSTLSLKSNRILFSGAVTDLGGSSIAIGDATTMGSLRTTGPIGNRTHVSNIAIGSNALENGTEMQYNVAIGVSAMKNIGQNSADDYGDCARNTAIGTGALQGNEVGRPQAYENVSIGYASMSSADTISDASTMTCKWNVAIGVTAGVNIEGQNNTCIGASSAFGLNAIASGNDNTLLGAGTKTSAADGENQIAIGKSAAGKGDNTAVIGNDDITAVYMSGDSGATVYCTSLTLKETTTPTAVADHAKLYTKTDNKLYFQDGAGTEHEVTIS